MRGKLKRSKILAKSDMQNDAEELEWILNPEQCRPISNAERYTIVVRDLRALRGKDEERRICYR